MRLAGSQAHVLSSACAAAASLVALRHAARTGRGQCTTAAAAHSLRQSEPSVSPAQHLGAAARQHELHGTQRVTLAFGDRRHSHRVAQDGRLCDAGRELRRTGRRQRDATILVATNVGFRRKKERGLADRHRIYGPGSTRSVSQAFRPDNLVLDRAHAVGGLLVGGDSVADFVSSAGSFETIRHNRGRRPLLQIPQPQ